MTDEEFDPEHARLERRAAAYSAAYGPNSVTAEFARRELIEYLAARRNAAADRGDDDEVNRLDDLWVDAGGTLLVSPTGRPRS